MSIRVRALHSLTHANVPPMTISSSSREVCIWSPKCAGKYCTSRLDTCRDTVRLPGVNRTLVIIKPDGVERGLVGEIISRLEVKQLRLVAAELRTIDAETARRHYAEHEGKSFFEPLVTSSPVLRHWSLVIEGPDDTWRIVRAMMGATNPADAAPGTIRGDLATAMSENLIHGSDSIESALREISIFFPDLV